MIKCLLLSFFLVDDLISIKLDESAAALFIFNLSSLGVDYWIEIRLKFGLYRLYLVFFTLDELFAALHES